MKKIIIIGCPGSGKSTFAKKLHNITEIPLYHLDMMFWNEDKTTVEKEVFYGRLRDAMSNTSWIIDGNYGSTMEMRFAECDAVFFLDYSVEICLEGIEERRGKKRTDIPWVENEAGEEFISFIKNFSKESRPRIIELINKYPCKKVIIFETREESEEYLKKLEEDKNEKED